MTLEADFSAGGTYSLRINVDPRIFLATDPTTLPPVPASWYREQTPEQIAATHQKAQEYLSGALVVLFEGKKDVLPACEIQPIDGSDNTPLKADTLEVHLLAVAKGEVPAGATTFQIDFAHDANTSLILLHTQGGNSDLRPQVIFPGETSRAFHLKAAAPPVTASPASPQAAPSAKQSPSPASDANRLYLIVAVSITAILVIVGWQLLKHYRHHHRFHRRPKPNDVNN
ncbi:hypothetical protein [Prosthecobacter sp.]|uniref:hypothetical protein n=1 Tax=Prosthecobacter sp. TaxID=1965333 RepID=UPI001D751002|nr:hypothetical protein [Prosthecobacter sp.]MCB1279203.1 hypothetical protein [Prosthecobacter sp.]